MQNLTDCAACDLRVHCSGPVPGQPPTSGVGVDGRPQVFLLGEAPGVNEDQRRMPFVGEAGAVLDNLLVQAGTHRDLCYVTNTVKCRPSGNATPKPQHIAACRLWLDEELATVEPTSGILVALGGTAMSALGITGGVELNHGRPIIGLAVWPGVVLPTYHPAAGLHDSSKLRQLQEDFHVLRRLLRGETPESLWVKDEYPQPVYWEATAAQAAMLLEGTEYALDTEATAGGRLWSIQIAVTPGSSWFIGPEAVQQLRETYSDGAIRTPTDSHVIVHNWMYERTQLVIPNFTDTMVMAYQLGLPQGLKELARRLCGIDMHSYNDVLAPTRSKKIVAYLERAAQIDWGPADKVGKKQPQPISRKIRRILADKMNSPDTIDCWDRWSNIPEEERERVEAVFGLLRVDLSDLDRAAAIAYAARDADATLRVYRTMLE